MKRISFVEEMREAVLDNRKSMTRRLGKCPYKVGDVLGIGEPHRLWAKERTYQHRVGQDRGEVDFAQMSALICQYDDGMQQEVPLTESEKAAWLAKKTVGLVDALGIVRSPTQRRSGRFLPDPFIRDCIRITAIRREHLQSITPADARLEGAPETSGHPAFYAFGMQSYVRWFAALWDDLNGKRPGGARFADNPDVWVLSFERVI